MSEQDNKTNDRAEQAADMLLFAPIGAALYIKDMAPMVINMLAQRGKTQVEQSTTMAKNMFTLAKSLGQARVNQAQQDVQKRTTEARGAADRTLKVVQGFGRTAGTAPQPASSRPAGTSPASAPSDNGRSAESAPVSPETTPPAAESGPVGTPPDLAIPDYDSLSATQVAARLAGLDSVELEAVRGYEVANRGRKTIVGKIDSLLSK